MALWHRRRGHRRRQRQHRRLARRSPSALGARVVSVAGARLRRRAAGRHRRGARPLRHHGRRRRQLRLLEPSGRSSRSCAPGYDLVMGNRFAGGIAPGAMPWLHRYARQPGADRARPAVLPQPGGRLPLRAARLPQGRRSCALDLQHHRHGVRERDGGQGDARAICAITEVPTTLSPDGREPRRRTCAPGATAGGTCASCCSTARAGCSSIPGCC